MNPAQEYRDLLHLVEQESSTHDDVYTELLKRENKVLELVSRMSQQAKDNKTKSNLFLEGSLLDLIAKFSYTWTNIFQELVIEKNYDQWFSIVFKDERKIYVGCMFILLALFLFFISMTSD